MKTSFLFPSLSDSKCHIRLFRRLSLNILAPTHGIDDRISHSQHARRARVENRAALFATSGDSTSAVAVRREGNFELQICLFTQDECDQWSHSE